MLESPFAPEGDQPEIPSVPEPIENFRKVMAERLEECRRLSFREEWFLGLDAYTAFVPLSGYVPQAIERKLAKSLPTRWDVGKEGYRVYWLKVDGEKFDPRYFSFKPSSWDRIRCYICEYTMHAPRPCFFCDRPQIAICDRCHGWLIG